MKDKCYILGASGFLGSYLSAYKSKDYEIIGLNKSNINFLKESTFSNISFSNETIIDCININNGVDEDIINCNIVGFKTFIDYLRNISFKGKYIYISTISVLDKAACDSSVYVKSKKQAEDILMNSGLNHQIIRISYPFGRNENPQRLLPKLKQQLLESKPLKIKNVKVNLNYIVDLSKAIFDSVGKKGEVFVSNNQYVSLDDVVLRMKRKLKSKSEIILENVEYSFTPLADSPYQVDYNVLDKLEEVLS